MIATGSVVRALPGAGMLGSVRTLRTVADCAALHDELQPGRHLVVVGAGFIGLEVAATAREAGLDVSVVELAPAPLSRVLGSETGRWFREFHARNGVDVLCGKAI